MPQPTLLAIFAHPDDEAFGTGGSLSRYAASGVQVALICATRGEVGEISDPSYATPDTLGEVRESELRCAAETMGIKELIFMNYRDSGMVGTPENDDPRAFINAPAGEVIHSLVSAIRRIQPDVVVTFEPNGGYGHPDHITIHKHTVAAFHLAADPATPALADGERPWQASRLFYTAIPRSFFLEMRQQLQQAGEDVEQFASFEERGWPDEQVTVTLDVSATVEDKWQALHCHRTQFGPKNLFRRLPEPVVKQLMSREHFALAWPASPSGLKMADLFEGLA
jgi:LmbE family N-acetylglucosaminyl deacetylase